MAFSPDGQMLASAGWGLVWLWRAVWDEREACELASPFVAREQLDPYLPNDWDAVCDYR